MKKFNLKNLIILMIFILCMMSFSSIALENEKKIYLMADISVPVSVKDCKNKQFNVVKSYFKDAGFTNIELTQIINDGFFSKEGKVSEVTINGNKSFKKGDRFSADSKVRITYFVEPMYEEEYEYADDEYFVPMEIKNNNDLLGTWVQTNANDDVSYYAEIDEDTITVFAFFATDESTELYWTGTFNSNIDIKKKIDISSKNYRFITDSFDYTSHSDYKTFTYEDSKITYVTTYLGRNETVVLEKDTEDWAQTVKLTGNRQEGYNVSTNNKVEIAGLEISYPYYYDSKDETSKEDDMIFYPSDNTAYSELELSYINTDEMIEEEYMLDFAYDLINDPEGGAYVLEQDEMRVDGISGVKTLYMTANGMGANGMLFVNNGLEIVFIDITFSYNDRSKNNYIKDFENIITNIKQVGKSV